ncbi:MULTISPECIES: hypothetical protein [Pseudonocardia]|uniref:hypothetical protein n=1 Tax=Pseudonocardia TaxID=1847 RepID=UPI000F7B83CB|nr:MULTISPECIES: hypothetical protein [Pseudonocardia]
MLDVGGPPLDQPDRGGGGTFLLSPAIDGIGIHDTILILGGDPGRPTGRGVAVGNPGRAPVQSLSGARCAATSATTAKEA